MNGKPSRASEFFLQIKEAPDRAQVLKDLVTNKKPENDFLEFKGAGRITDPQIKEYWSTALSGFANTEGGVIIWGIRATKIPDPGGGPRKIDCATDLDLAPSPTGLMQLLRDVRLEATIDPVVGVDMLPVNAGAGDGSGFVVCLIPESTHKPHRAQLEEARQYWQRIGDSFVMIPHSLLRTLFYPRNQARVHIRADLLWYRRQTAEDRGQLVAVMQCHFRITNTGSATVNNAFIRLQVDAGPVEGLQFTPKEDWSNDKLPFASVEAKRPLHPGADSEFFVLDWKVPTKGLQSDGQVFIPDCSNPAFLVEVYAENQQKQTFRIMFGQQALLDNRTTTVEGELVEEATVEETR